MPKAVKRVIRKKKQVKKNIHDKLKRRNNSNLQQLPQPDNMFSMNQQTNQINALTNQPSAPSNAKNLRNQLIARSMGMNPIGFFPQQYGNVNEQRLRELQQNNQMMIDRNNKDTAANEALKKENEDLKQRNQQLIDEGKAAKKELKKTKRDYERAKDQHIYAEDDLEDANRLHEKLVHENEKQQRAQIEAMQIHAENEEIKLQPKIIGLESRIHTYRIAQEEMKRQINLNQQYQLIRQKEAELAIIEAQNAALKNEINSDAFKNPNQVLIDTFQKEHRAKVENELLKDSLATKDEAVKLSVQLQSIPDRYTNDAVMQQIIAQTKQYNQDNELLKIQMKLNEEPINDFNHALEQRSKAKYEAADTSIENDRLQSKIKAINQNNPNDKVNSDIKSEA